MRTADDFIDDMLEHKRTWMDILAVGRVVRDGKWKEDVRRILVERSLMPENTEEVKALLSKDLEEKRRTPPPSKYEKTWRKV